MTIKILGNGGAISDGLPYNSFLIGDFLLAETPPDIMTSLFREKVDLSKIISIFISHYHADHFFGFPFLMLRLFFDGSAIEITVYGPSHIEQKVYELCACAFGKDHPMLEWMRSSLVFNELSLRKNFVLCEDLLLQPIPMSHFTETWGFVLCENSVPIFSYFADTHWSDGLVDEIKRSPKVILTDMNGEPTDSSPVHLSEKDIIEKCLPVSGENTIYYGTHLKCNKRSSHERIIYVRPGDSIEI